MNKVQLRLLAVFALAVMLTFAGAAFAEDSTGKFKAALADNETFMVMEGEQEHTYRLAAKAAILIDAQVATLSDLKAGDTVTVTWDLRNERRVATMVTCNRQ